MVVKMRLARFGRRNQPFYNIVVTQARTARDSRPLEVIGTYDPIPKGDSYDTSGKLHKDIKLDKRRAQYWVGVGAQPTETVWRLLSMIGILQPKVNPPLPKQRAVPKWTGLFDTKKAPASKKPNAPPPQPN
ncbi:ribosomal protein S16, mitochondrial [Lasiosphaeria miniovina]|uniref:Ribosomal protein S16, mitochondrial n=1 Tax=Lasiosphaeria miniovina TaxID=1954250 RepID=A0AA40B360_9PEZI|nr:ribosomal protein S16, mitochondrial [Lasiosphaeria miniovina]KAK0726835.1 ribosomal protein S16, mitochondrial [Lasiosphaeria miniovina]